MSRIVMFLRPEETKRREHGQRGYPARHHRPGKPRLKLLALLDGVTVASVFVPAEHTGADLLLAGAKLAEKLEERGL